MRKLLSCLFVCVIYACFASVAHACTANEIDVVGDGTNCQTAKFTITTTELTADTTFAFYMSAMGTFYVDWGDGTVDNITRTDTTETLYDHTYTTGGVKTIRFGGLATEYSSANIAAIWFSNGSATPTLIATLTGSLGHIFPTLENRKTKQPQFRQTFDSCTNLSSIPAELFDGVTGNTHEMFSYTFGRCIKLTQIPYGLFSGIYGSNVAMFYGTFISSGVRLLPDDLFAGVYGKAYSMFFRTFSGCSNLSGYISPSTFAGLNNSGLYTTDMMHAVFAGTNLATTCPPGTEQFVTGYEDYWDGHVSCVDENLVCDVGEYLPAHGYECVTCPENNYCSGGTYPYSESTASGATACAAGMYAPVGMSSATQCGHILHIGNEVVYLHSVKKTSPSLHAKLGNDIFYGNMTTADVVMHAGSTRKLKMKYNGVVYSVYDDTIEPNE